MFHRKLVSPATSCRWSAGLATWDRVEERKRLLEHADAARYAAKAHGERRPVAVAPGVTGGPPDARSLVWAETSGRGREPFYWIATPEPLRSLSEAPMNRRATAGTRRSQGVVGFRRLGRDRVDRSGRLPVFRVVVLAPS